MKKSYLFVYAKIVHIIFHFLQCKNGRLSQCLHLCFSIIIFMNDFIYCESFFRLQLFSIVFVFTWLQSQNFILNTHIVLFLHIFAELRTFMFLTEISLHRGSYFFSPMHTQSFIKTFIKHETFPTTSIYYNLNTALKDFIKNHSNRNRLIWCTTNLH